MRCLSDGRGVAIQYLKDSDSFDSNELDVWKIIMTESGVNMLSPYFRATSVGILVGDRALYDLKVRIQMVMSVKR